MAPKLTFTIYKRLLKGIETQLNLISSKIPENINLLTSSQIGVFNGNLKKLSSDIDSFIERFTLSETLPEGLTEEQLSLDVTTLKSQILQLELNLNSFQTNVLPMSSVADSPQQTVEILSTPMNHSLVTLPKLQLKTFSGDFASWPSYISNFKSVIDNNESLSATQKYQYLCTSLHSKPLEIISHLPLCDESYPIALDLLDKRYNNSKRQIMHHCDQLLHLPKLVDFKADNLRKFLDTYHVHINALNIISSYQDAVQVFFTNFLLSKLNSELKLKFETSLHSTEFPSSEDLIQFLTNFAIHQENTTAINIQTKSYNESKSKRNINHSSFFTSVAACISCGQNHQLFQCSKFLDLNPKDRFSFIKQHNYCVNCLRSHLVNKCLSSHNCKICGLKHNTLLHFTSNNKQPPQKSSLNQHQQFKMPNQQISQQSENTHQIPISSSNSLLSTFPKSSTVLLATALIRIQIHPNQYRIIRAVLDTASHVSFITSAALQHLPCTRIKNSSLTITGVSNIPATSKGATLLSVATLKGDVIIDNHQFLVLDNITSNLPRVEISPLNHLTSQYVLADPLYHKPGPIDALLGADITAQLITGCPFSLGIDLPYMIQTKLGFVLLGNAPTSQLNSNSPSSNLSCLQTSLDDTLSSSIEQFWKVEEPPMWISKQSVDDQFCEDYFKSNTQRTSNGSYQTRLPFKTGIPLPLGDSYHQAYNRLLALERKFSINSEFKQKYISFMDEYEQLGHMTPLINHQEVKYFIPHHGIFKRHGDTSKLRVVFDASAKTTNGFSLNDILHSGPKLQTLISNVITFFRIYPIVFSCDIKQMYRMIQIHADDQLFQCILWRTDSSKPIKVYKLCTVTYGVTSAPYLALRILQQLALDEGIHFPNAAQVLKHNIFVDDIITGANSVSEALQLKIELTNLLKSGGFLLRKWCSNISALLSDVPNEHKESINTFPQSNHHFISILGLSWNPVEDNFILQLPKFKLSSSTNITKRIILSFIAQIYDPCGWLTPCVMKPKCFIQKLWLQPLGWDDILPSNLIIEFQQLLNSFNQFHYLSFPRSFPRNVHSVQIHGFADASQCGYAAVIYLRFSFDNSFSTLLIWSRSRVAPIKTISIPRLELLGAHLLANLIAHFEETFSSVFPIESIHLWTDSNIVLHWINIPPYKLKTFVANRVAQITEVTEPANWHHISSSSNPADLASRGVDPNILKDNALWWSGPSFLSLPQHCWPNSKSSFHFNESELELKPVTSLITTNSSYQFFEHLSSWPKVVRIMIYILKFVSRHSKNFVSNYINAENALCKYVQYHSFNQELSNLSQGKPCKREIQRLHPFVDSNGIIRVGGRLANSSLRYTHKHPILLPKNNYLVKLLINFYHTSHLHSGPKHTQSLLAEKFWILSARQVIRSQISKCIKCFRVNPSNIPQLMGNLPSARVNPSPIFFNTGLDFAGPFMVKAFDLRKAPQIKVYICIFICFATKAIHLEVAKDLSTSAFIETLQRFISRRGIPNNIYCDCGTNFIGAESQLSKQFRQILSDNQQSLLNFASLHQINFHFNPPASPHQGGLWERAVRSTKHHLIRVLGTYVPTYEHFCTLIVRIEAILNSRPITPLSSDPSDFEALTPGHFLIGRPLTSFPEPDLVQTPDNRLKHYNLIQAFTQRFWKRWRTEYLTSLQIRSKWINSTSNLQEGELVLINEPNVPPLVWPLGRITKVSPGTDGIVRVAEVKTSRGTYLRPTIKLYPLPHQ